jgi:quercetin dioxygenase-like cupin family protein
VEGDRLIVALMRMPAGTGADAHSHPNEQWIYVLEGTLRATIRGLDYEAKPGTLLYIPTYVVHSVTATPDRDGVFFTAKDASRSSRSRATGGFLCMAPHRLVVRNATYLGPPVCMHRVRLQRA